MARSHNVTALFGGIGGLELGLHRSGHRTSLYCECDPDAVAVLSTRFPDVPITFDVRKTDEVVAGIDPRSDLLTAGFPCTDLSQAGTTRGFAGGRSSLIRETLELLKRRPFPHVLIENVPNWRFLHRGAYLEEVLEALERLGYRWAYRTIDARSFGVPQRRLRIFLYATLDGSPRDVLFHGDAIPDHREFDLAAAAHGFYWTEGNRGLGWGEDCVPTLKGGSSIGIPAPPAILMPDGRLVTPDIRDAERLQGFPSGWTDIEERPARVGGGRFVGRRRWLLVGNAVNVEASAWIGERLSRPSKWAGEEGGRLAPGDPWPAAAWYDGEHRRVAAVGPWPALVARSPLASFLEHGGSPLSRRATAGFLGRISKSRLRFKPGFAAAVRCHLDRMAALDEAAVERARGDVREPEVVLA